MNLTINGEPRDIPGVTNIAELITLLDLPPATLLVEHNTLPVRRDEWPTRPLTDGDQIELLRISAGG